MFKIKSIISIGLCLAVMATLTIPAALQAKTPFVNPAEDLKHLGKDENLLFWEPEQQVASYRNIDKIFPTRVGHKRWRHCF